MQASGSGGSLFSTTAGVRPHLERYFRTLEILAVYFIHLLLLLYLPQFKADRMENILGITEFQNCWITIYRNPKIELSDPLRFDQPVAFPETKFHGLQFFQSKAINVSSAWPGYTSVKKYLYCSAYFLLYPEWWNVTWIGDNEKRWRNRCWFWHEYWRILAPFRDGIDFVIIFTNNIGMCRRSGEGAAPIIRNNLIISANASLANGTFTIQNPFLVSLTCPESHFRECLATTWKQSTNNGKTLRLDPVRRFNTGFGMYAIKTGFWDESVSKHNYTLINNKVIQLDNPFNPPPRNYGSLHAKMKLLATDVIEIWIPTWHSQERLPVPNPVSFILSKFEKLGPEREPNDHFLFQDGFISRTQFTVTGSYGMSFTTKHGVTRRQSFNLYFTPYDLPSWMGIVSYTLLLPLFYVFSATALHSPSKCSILESVIMLNIAALLRVSPHIGNNVFNDRLRRVFYCTIGIWLMLLVILVEGYVGVIVSDLVVPPPWMRKFENLTHLDGFANFGQASLITEHNKLYLGLGKNYAYRVQTFGDIWYCECKKKD